MGIERDILLDGPTLMDIHTVSILVGSDLVSLLADTTV